MEIGVYRKQPQGYKAFIPHKFPPKAGFKLTPQIISKANRATLALGKLDGITTLLPDVDFFLFMYIRKDAASSSQIEGTKATLIDAIEAESKTSEDLPEDVDDILHYIKALNFGLERLNDMPMSLRLIKEIHQTLMKEGRASHYCDPGNFRKSQNWIGGTRPDNALYVPPPAADMRRVMGDLELFMQQKDDLFPIVKTGLIHAQFETIHPFLDGNGRTGRMLITLNLYLQKLLERPVLFLSSYFRKQRQLYYARLEEYHNNKVERWLDFFLEGVLDTAREAALTVEKINQLRADDMQKMHALGKSSAQSSLDILMKLYKLPVVNVSKIQEWTGYTRQGAQKMINRLIELGILEQKDESVTYGRSYIYRRYVNLFTD